MTSNTCAPNAANHRDSTKRTSSASRAAFALATPSAAALTSLAVTCASGRVRFTASAIAPLPVPTSSTAGRASPSIAASVSSTSSSVSGRGINTSGDTRSGSEKNSRSPVRYASGSPLGAARDAGGKALRSRGLERALGKRQQRAARLARREREQHFGIELRRRADGRERASRGRQRQRRSRPRPPRSRRTCGACS